MNLGTMVDLPLTTVSSQSVFGSFEARFFLRCPCQPEYTEMGRNQQGGIIRGLYWGLYDGNRPISRPLGMAIEREPRLKNPKARGPKMVSSPGGIPLRNGRLRNLQSRGFQLRNTAHDRQPQLRAPEAYCMVESVSFVSEFPPRWDRYLGHPRPHR